ncbi:MAG: amino acid amidase [Arthrobacter sp.]|nr:amino acid amidase [Arthrobacter sp.]MCW3009627.1 amino acid amidase [Solirubrobacterales bacterium]
MSTRTGTVEWDGHRTWYRVDGEIDPADPDAPAPLVVLHGGPGFPHDYLESLAALHSETGRTVVMYDQIGGGRSDHLPDADPSFWTVDLFKQELERVLEALGVAGGYHLLGQSWGGMLAMEHALDDPAGLLSLVIANSPASMDLWVREANRLRADLPPDVQATLTRHEQAGTTDDPAYEEAMMAFYERHVCRLPQPWPEEVQRAFATVAEDPTVYNTMNGPSEFHVIGVIKDWDITDRLPEIQVPCLVIAGEFDEATPAVIAPIVAGLADVRSVVMDGTSHLSHVEAPERFRRLVAGFLAEQDDAED